MKVGEGGRVVSCAVLVATGLNNDGHREVLGVRVSTSQTAPAWKEFFADLVARGLTGVRLVTSDTHPGLIDATANMPGATWQRCRTHYAANLMLVTPKSTMARHQSDAALGVRPARRHPLSTANTTGSWTTSKTNSPPSLNTSTKPEQTPSPPLPPNGVWTQIRSNNPNKRLNREIHQHTNPVGISPNHQPIIHPIGAVLTKQNNE